MSFFSAARALGAAAALGRGPARRGAGAAVPGATSGAGDAVTSIVGGGAPVEAAVTFGVALGGADGSAAALGAAATGDAAAGVGARVVTTNAATRRPSTATAKPTRMGPRDERVGFGSDAVVDTGVTVCTLSGPGPVGTDGGVIPASRAECARTEGALWRTACAKASRGYV